MAENLKTQTGMGWVDAPVSGGFTHFGLVGAGQVAKMVKQVLVLNNYAIHADVQSGHVAVPHPVLKGTSGAGWDISVEVV